MSKEGVCFTPFKPMELIEGVTIEEIKKIPSVQALVEDHLEKELSRSYKIGHAEGLELGRNEGKEQAYKDAFTEHKSSLDLLFSEAKCEISELIVQLRNPLIDCQKSVKASMFKTFNEVIVEFVSNPEIYDEKLVKCIDELITQLPENNRDLIINVSDKVTDGFKEILGSFDIKFKTVEMNDLFHVYSESGNYRMNVKEFSQALL